MCNIVYLPCEFFVRNTRDLTGSTYRRGEAHPCSTHFTCVEFPVNNSRRHIKRTFKPIRSVLQ